MNGYSPNTDWEPHIDAVWNAHEPIMVWRFHEAPVEFRRLSEHGGDEDWLALVPPAKADEWVGWIGDGGTAFGVCDVSRHPMRDGYVVYIGAHA